MLIAERVMIGGLVLLPVLISGLVLLLVLLDGLVLLSVLLLLVGAGYGWWVDW